jgi:uncharacterized protein (DUF1330 family)
MTDAVDPTPEDIQKLLAEAGNGPIVMLNLLRYKPDGGRERYADYAAKTFPFLQGVGGEILYAGDTGLALVAPDSHEWDTVAIVRYPSAAKFLEMVGNPEYLEVSKIRSGALDAAVLQVTQPAAGVA